MNKKHIIGIVGKVQPKYDEDLWHRIDECDEIRYLIVKNGGNPIMLLPTEITMKFNDNDIKDESVLNKEQLTDLEQQLNLCDGIILQGGLYSIHSMIATKELVEKVAKISSFSEDGLVESFEVPNKKFVVGIKWHPELMLEESYVDKIFEKFIDCCN